MVPRTDQSLLHHTWVAIIIAVLMALTFFFSFLAFSQPPELSNGESTRKLPQGVVYGVVRRSDPNQQKEMVVYGWSTNQLKEEMNYIKDVSYSRIFCFLFFEADRRVESEAWMGMLSRHFEKSYLRWKCFSISLW